ncbi:MAG TPA: ribosome maturation factor RimP [Terriglobales bacterium]|nr:ribosome maturation factor RimP [Terriglobales bacterium]
MTNLTNSNQAWQDRLGPVVARAAAELVAVEQHGDTLRVYIDQPQGVGLDDCERVSKELGAALTELEDWNLEVSSPGEDRPLVKREDFERFAGRRAKVQSRNPIEGSRNFVGALDGADAAGVRVKLENGASVVVAWDNLAQARLAPLPQIPARAK